MIKAEEKLSQGLILEEKYGSGGGGGDTIFLQIVITRELFVIEERFSVYQFPSQALFK